MSARARTGLCRLVLASGLVLTGLTVAAAATPALHAGAASAVIAVPDGTPLGGYGGFPRRAVVPDVLGRFPHAFWFNPSTGVHDLPKARALVLEAGATRLLWLTVDLVGVDPTLLGELRQRLARSGLSYSALIVSASHTHSGPGAYADSALFGIVALDRLSTVVRSRILDAVERAARGAEARKGPARVGAGRTEVKEVARSRLRAAVDPELVVLKVVTPDDRPVALLWNYAIHGTALGRDNSLLSGDLMAEASSRIEQRLDAPALFVNGAVADVSPARHGREGVRLAGAALSAAAISVWDRVAPERAAGLSVRVERVVLPAPALALRNCLGRWLPRWLRVGLGGALPDSAELVAVAVGRSAWVTIPGELETRLGRDLKAVGQAVFRVVAVAGVSNDYLGYFLTPQAFERPSYIACASLYGERGGERMRDAAAALLGRLAATAPAR